MKGRFRSSLSLRWNRAAFALFLATVAGCSSVPLQNGRLSKTYVKRLEPIAGDYEGSLRLATPDGKVDQPLRDHVGLKLTVEQDGTLALDTDSDWLGPDCEMKIGKLIEFRQVNGALPTDFDAHFELDPGRCRAQVQETTVLLVSTTDQGKHFLKTYLLKEYTALRARRGGLRPLNYVGQFKKVKSNF